jgi:hypothetical protein
MPASSGSKALSRSEGFALSFWPLARLAQNEERRCDRGEAGSRRGLRTVTHHEHLAQADRLIADCLDRIARQREVITTEYEQGLMTNAAAAAWFGAPH